MNESSSKVQSSNLINRVPGEPSATPKDNKLGNFDGQTVAIDYNVNASTDDDKTKNMIIIKLKQFSSCFLFYIKPNKSGATINKILCIAFTFSGAKTSLCLSIGSFI